MKFEEVPEHAMANTYTKYGKSEILSVALDFLYSGNSVYNSSLKFLRLVIVRRLLDASESLLLIEGDIPVNNHTSIIAFSWLLNLLN